VISVIMVLTAILMNIVQDMINKGRAAAHSF